MAAARAARTKTRAGISLLFRKGLSSCARENSACSLSPVISTAGGVTLVLDSVSSVDLVDTCPVIIDTIIIASSAVHNRNLVPYFVDFSHVLRCQFVKNCLSDFMSEVKQKCNHCHDTQTNYAGTATEDGVNIGHQERGEVAQNLGVKCRMSYDWRKEAARS